MRILLDTNIVIHREANKVVNKDIGHLFRWLDKLKYTKCIHPITIEELQKNKNKDVVDTINIKVENYNPLRSQAAIEPKMQEIIDILDKTQNDINDSKILNEVLAGRVDVLISEDKKIFTKAEKLNISDKVFKIDSFLEKVISENPDLVDYNVLSIKKEYFGNINLNDEFFDSFREDYNGFDAWFKKKSDEISYVFYDNKTLSAFLYIKTETDEENYSDISPIFDKKRRLKIGTFKVTTNGYRIGERFLKIIFDNALKQKVSEVYVTIFDKGMEHERLISLLEDWGFKFWGYKNTNEKKEKVYVKNFDKKTIVADRNNPKATFPFFVKNTDVFIVPIYEEYHTSLFPDSILKTESPLDFVENKPHRNSLSKVYISRSIQRNLKSGDIIIFYRTGGKYKGVATTIGIVESIVDNIKDKETFIDSCKKRSVFDENELEKHWDFNKNNRPFIVNFLYAYSYPKRPNLNWLMENSIISKAPRGFEKISKESFYKIADYAYK